ncbi:amino acid ABC transporter permease [Roseovarius sp. ZX-A-9]|uniref:amino acid ABC transporter permease n=1 Tax=Roseovarius sp. ZX-A-9 TaxID=3014783 RepID=UPI00232F4B69|nr:amino acid ABC transporter permease [Roseovarius sp. ZX-A-9]
MSDTHAHSVAFVRETAIPPAPPPATEAGVIGWMRQNLFATWANALLTVVAIYFVYLLLTGTLPWILGGLWNTDSLAECREILQGKNAACFSVLTERWNQLLFGFKYPDEFYWRPGIAFILLFLAAAPVLFFDLPRKLLLFTAIYPFLAFWLIWGGTVWNPVFAALGFIAGYVVFDLYGKQNFAAGFFGGIVAAFVVWFLAGYIVPAIAPEQPVLEAVQSRDMGGFMLNMILGVVCVSLSLPLGIALALGRQSSMPLIKWICVVFIEFIRGVPLITLLFVANVVLAYFLPPGTTFDLILRVIIMITMFASAYIAEVIRGGLAALPKGQYEAADSLGLDYAQAMRLIVLPQALKISIPGIVNVSVGLFKDTTLVSIITMFDLVGMIRGPILASTEWNGVYWELFSFAAVLFFITCYGISQYSQWLERRLTTDHR